MLATVAAEAEALAAAEEESEAAAWSKYREDWRLTASAQVNRGTAHYAMVMEEGTTFGADGGL